MRKLWFDGLPQPAEGPENYLFPPRQEPKLYNTYMKEFTDPNNLLIILGIVAIVVEIIIGVATGFELLVLGVIMILGGVIGLLFGSFQYGVISMTALIAIYLFFGRKMIKKSLNITTHKTNSDSIVGSVATVVTEVKSDVVGQVKIGGEVWRAESAEDLAVGEKVTVQSISGVTVRVERESIK